MGKSKLRRRGIVIFFAMMMVTILLLTGCGSGDSDNNSNSGTASAGSSYNMSEEMKMADRGEMDDGDAPAVVVTSDEAFANRASTSEGASVAPQLSEPVNNGPITNTRKLIYRANVTMEVEEYGKAQTELFNLVTLSGGYMLTFNDFRNSYEEGGTFVVKVPANGFQSFLTGLEKLKKDDEFQRNVQGQDVSEEYVDLEARLKAKQVVEDRLLSLMEKAVGTDDLLAFSRELAQVQEEIEQLKGRMRYLDNNVAFSTVELRMYQVTDQEKKSEKEETNAFKRAGNALLSSIDGVIDFLEGLLVFGAGALPILLVLAIIAIPTWRLYLHRKRNLKRQPEQQKQEAYPAEQGEKDE